VTMNLLLESETQIAPNSDGKLCEAPYCEAAFEDRCAPRRNVRMPAVFRPSGSEGFNVIIHDISLSGFSAQALTCQPVGTRVWITIPGLAPLQAEIARNDRTNVGCAFTQLLNQAVLDNLVARYRVEE
jgi:PilZ domain